MCKQNETKNGNEYGKWRFPNECGCCQILPIWTEKETSKTDCPYELKKKPEKKVLYKRTYRERGRLPSFSLFFLHGIFFIIVSIKIWHDEHAVISTGLYINMWNYDQNWEKDVISNAKLWKHCWQLRLASYCASPWLKKTKKSPRALDTK